MEDAIIGTRVDDYRIQEVLGRGGMGVVYRAEDVNLSRTVAIKRINPSQADREEFIHRFRSEAKALARIDSSHIVRVYALRETDVGLLIVMEFVDGGTLKDPLEEGRIFTPETAVPVLRQILKAFDDAHSAGVIHRDIKPQNIMLTGEGSVKVTDFGIAKMRRTDSGETVTQGGQGGTLNYMSPEQVSSIEDVDARSDLYSIGMTAYEMMAGRLPFDDMQTDFDVMRTVVEGSVPPPSEYNADIPGPLVDWIQTATAKKQGDRYQDARAMLEALEDAVQHAGISPAAPGELDLQAAGATPDPDDPASGSTATAGGTVLADDSPAADAPAEEEEGGAGASGGATVTAMPGGDAEDTGSEGDPSESATGGETVAAGGADDTERRDAGHEDRSDQPALPWSIVAAALLVLGGGGAFAYSFMGGGADGGSGSATLSVSTRPADAVVRVNDRRVGTTPVAGVSVEAGAVRVEIEKQGYARLDSAVTVAAGGQVDLSGVRLAPATASEGDAGEGDAGEGSGGEATSDAGESEDASASNDGTGASQSENTQNENTQPEDAQSGDARAEDAQPDEQVAADAEAEPQTSTEASAAVTVTAPDAVEVSVDGARQPAGAAVTLVPGTHEVACSHPDYPGHSPITTNVRVEAGESAEVACAFERTVNVTTGLGDPYGTVYVDGGNTQEQTPATLRLGPGEHTVELRRRGSYRVRGVAHRVRSPDGSRKNEFSESSYRLTIEPGFDDVSHAISFRVQSE